MAERYQTRLEPNRHLMDRREQGNRLASSIMQYGALAGVAISGVRAFARSGALVDAASRASALLRATRSGALEGFSDIPALQRVYREGLEGRGLTFEIDRLVRERAALRARVTAMHERGETQAVASAFRAIDEAMIERLRASGAWGTIFGARAASVYEVGIDRLSAEARAWVQELEQRVPGISRSLRADAAILAGGRGGIQDLRPLRDLTLRTGDWWARTIPGGILHLRDIVEQARAPLGTILPSGTLHPALSRGPLQNNILVVGGKALDLSTGAVVRENLELIPGRYSTQGQILAMMSGIGQPEEPRTMFGSILRRAGLDRLLDIGYQRGPTAGNYLQAFFGKFFNPNWTRNMVLDSMRSGESITEAQVRRIGSLIQHRTPSFSRSVFEALEAYLPEEFRGLSFLTPEEALQSLQRVAQRHGASFHIQRLAAAASADPESFLRRRRVEAVRIPGLGHIRIDTPEDEIRRAISVETVLEMGPERLRENLRIAQELGDATRIDLQKAEEIIAAAQWLTQVGRTGARDAVTDQMIRAARSILQSDDPRARSFQDALARIARREAPVYSVGPFPEVATEDELLGLGGSPYTVVSRSRVGRSGQHLRGINRLTAEAAQALTELSAGRKNIEEVTRLTMMPFWAMMRLSTPLEGLGLGLSSISGASNWEMFKGIFLRRALLGYGIYQGLSYLDYAVGGITGRGLKQRYYDMMAGARLDIAGAIDTAGLTDELKREWDIGYDVYDPLSGLPFVGWPFQEPKSQTELEEYYRSGRQPIRSGRYWMLSSTPFRGDDISYFLPNEYRLGTSEWQMTGTVYGSEEQYWSHQPFPTPSFPLAPLRFLTDPYWLENLHREDRPYPLTGQLINPEIPLAPAINATLGQLIKPVRPMHEEALRRINEEIRRAGDIETLTGIERRGRILPMATTPVPGSPDVLFFGSESGVGGIESGGATGGGIPGGMVIVPSDVGISGLSFGSSGGSSGAARQTLAGINADIRSAALFQYIQESRAHPIDLIEPEPGPLLAPTDPRYHAKQMEYSMRELLGIYGFGAQTILGGEPLAGRTVIASANRMAGLQHTFWQSELGGLGGELSEIGRRFLPHPQRVEEWNPIPNQMPDWLPGSDYFINFRVGDPMTKVPMGEVRLPGEAYEATHTLHSDPLFGKYGAFERFKILADVAPYSSEYRLYEKTVRTMFRDGMLPEEWKAEFNRILEERREAASRYDFYERRFSEVGGNIERRTVTVGRILDSSTFLAIEEPEHPIRLAGVRLNQSMPISEFIRPGMKVDIAYNRIEDERYADDLLRTIRATVYVQGQNLNYELLRAGVGRETNEEHPAAIMARYSPSEISRGAMYEAVAHTNIPILHRKFMPVNSALEYYERYRVYGKEFQAWEAPVSGILAPTLRSYAMRDPITAAMSGAVTGGLIGQMILGGGRRTAGGAIIGAGISMLASVARTAQEVATGDRYIPEARERERELDEYFDVIEYVKFRGLYERAVKEARIREGKDIDRLLNQMKERQRERSAEIRRLEEIKRQLLLAGHGSRSPEVSRINQEIAEINSDRLEGIELGPWSQAAIYYRARYESTLYGLDLESPDYQMIYRALPTADREFFEVFSEEADPRKRKKILELVPENQRRIYQRMWGERVDPLPSLQEYFSEYPLPTPDWVGWRADVELDWVKATVAAEEGIELPEVGLWKTDLEEAQAIGIEPIDIRADGPIGWELKDRIQSILKGRGLTLIEIVSGPIARPGIEIEFDVLEDPRARIEEAIASGNWAS